VERIGEYPHAALNVAARTKVQSTRLLKAVCDDCGCTFRITRKWAEQAEAENADGMVCPMPECTGRAVVE
jgi:hypothetical protein